MFGKNGGLSDAACGQAARDLEIVEPHTHGQGRGCDLLRRRGQAGHLSLSGREGLQNGFYLSGEDLAGKELERKFDFLPWSNIAGIYLLESAPR